MVIKIKVPVSFAKQGCPIKVNSIRLMTAGIFIFRACFYLFENLV